MTLPFKPNSIILFQGDSITDAGRSYWHTDANQNAALGTGYAQMVAAQLLEEHPEQGWQFYNRGVSGNRVPDMQARWGRDALALKPDWISILIGVNDTWHGITMGAGVGVMEYEDRYRQVLGMTVKRLPEVRLVLCEPFVLVWGAVTEDWLGEIAQRQAVVRLLAEEFGAVFVPFQAAMDAAAQERPSAHWLSDGVHPTPAGHQLMAGIWLASVDQ
jgi:lysophospholipase L1-like esterase